MSVLSSIEEVARILELPNAAAQENIIRIETLARAAGISKSELLTKAQQMNAAKRNVSVQAVVPGKVVTGSLGFTLTKKAEAIYSTLDSLPFRHHNILTADENGDLAGQPYCKPGKKYLLMEVPDGVRINAQPPAIVAHGAMRCVCSLIAENFRIKETELKASVDVAPPAADKETPVATAPIVEVPASIVPPSKRKARRLTK